MLRVAVLVLCLLATSLDQSNAKNINTPNQILDAVIGRALGHIKKAGWDKTKNIQKGSTDFEMGIKQGGAASERFEIVDAFMTGVGSLTRSASATFLNNESVLKGTIKLKDARATATYKISFGGAGQAPGNNPSGTVTEKADNLFADIEINLKNKVPQNIRSFKVRKGHEGIESSSGLSDNFKQIDVTAIRKSLLQVLMKVMSTNMKVMVNRGIQDWKKEAAA